MATPKFVGIHANDTTKEATLTFMCKTKPSDETANQLTAVRFDIAEFCKSRLTGATKDGQPARLGWYSHWRKDDAGNIVHTRKKDNSTIENAGPSVASKFQLSHLEQQCLRESESYQKFVDSLPEKEFTDNDKIELKKFAKSHGSTREHGTQTPAEKAQTTIDNISNDVQSIVANADIDAETKDNLADSLENIASELVASLREPYAEQAAYNAKTQELEQAVHNADMALENIAPDSTQEQMYDAITAKTQAAQALATHMANPPAPPSAETETETPEGDSAETPETEQDSAETPPEPTPEAQAGTEQASE